MSGLECQGQGWGKCGWIEQSVCVLKVRAFLLSGEGSAERQTGSEGSLVKARPPGIRQGACTTILPWAGFGCTSAL